MLTWVAEVTDPESKRFKHFNEWQTRYEPKADAEEKGDGEEPGALQVRMLNYMSEQIRDNILHILLKMVSKLLGPAEDSVNSVDEDLGAFLNAANGIVLTFRYQYLNKDKFEYLRAYAADQVALSLGRAIAREKERLGHAADAELSPEQIAEVTGAVSERILKEIKDKEEMAHASLESNPMLAKAAASDERANEGIQQLKAFLRGYIKDKTDTMQDTIRAVVEKLLARVAASSVVIGRHAAALASKSAAAAPAPGADDEKSGEAAEAAPEPVQLRTTSSLISVPVGPDPLSADPDFVKVRQEILGEVEGAYATLSASVQKYVTGLVFMMVGAKPEDQARALEAARADAEGEAGSAEGALANEEAGGTA